MQEENKLNSYYPIIKNADNIITEKCYKKANEIYGKKLPKNVKERLDFELNSIIKNGFETIYLIYSDFVKKSNEFGYKTGFRGKVGNSLVAYFLNITSFNPLNYDLPFEFFAGIDYNQKPYIELNVSEEIIDKLVKYLQDRFGKSKVIKFENEICTRYYIFILPDNLEVDKSIDEHYLEEKGLYKFTIVKCYATTILNELEKITKTDSNFIDLNDNKTLQLFQYPNDKKYGTTKDIPDFENKHLCEMIDIVKPKNINELICILGLVEGRGTLENNAEILIKDEEIKIEQLISNRADLFKYFIENGIDREKSLKITEFTRKGKASNNRFKEEWVEYYKVMREHNIPKWFIKYIEKIKYLYPKAHLIENTINDFKIAWYKVHFPNEFKQIIGGKKDDRNK